MATTLPYGWTQVPDKIPIMTPALLLGVAFDLILFGILTAQAYIYYLSFAEDRVLLKVAVVLVYLAGVAQSSLALLDLCGSFIASTAVPVGAFVDPGYWLVGILGSDHLWLSITTSTAAVAIIIQSLFAHRIYLISEKLWLAIMIICLSLGQFASGMIGAICYSNSLEVQSAAMGLSTVIVGESTCYFGFTWIWGPMNVACDLTITVCMVTFLLKHRKRTMRHQLRSHITKVVQIVVETGMATTVLMIIYTVLFSLQNFATPSFTPFFPLPGLMMSKVYSNSMLVLLNNRATIANGRNGVESFEFVEVSPLQLLEGDTQLRKGSRISRAGMGAQNNGFQE